MRTKEKKNSDDLKITPEQYADLLKKADLRSIDLIACNVVYKDFDRDQRFQSPLLTTLNLLERMTAQLFSALT